MGASAKDSSLNSFCSFSTVRLIRTSLGLPLFLLPSGAHVRDGGTWNNFFVDL